MAAKSGKKKKAARSLPEKSGKNVKTQPEKGIDLFLARRRSACVWLSGLLSVMGLLAVYICMGIAPFGEKSVGTVDMVQQYIPFYASLKNALLRGGGLLYAPSLGMGGSYWGLIGYYLTSPFAALSLLIPNDRLPDYMAWLELLRTGLAGCSFAYCYSRKFRRKDLTVPLLSLCYALSAFFLTHLCTVVWTDCLVLLPLTVWGLEELLRGKKPWLYVLCLSAVGIGNYYIAMMIGVYLALYAAVFLAVSFREAEWAVILKKLLMFTASSLLSVGIAAGILLPSALLLRESGNAADSVGAGFWAVNPLRLLVQLLYHADSRILAEDSPPLLYCSVLTALCLPLFFLCKKIPLRVRIAFGALTGFLALSLSVNRLNFLWHGAHIPNHLPYRFAFLMVFTLLVMAGYVLDSLDEIPALTFDAVLCGMLAVAVAAYFAPGGGNTVMLAGTLLLAIAYTLLFVLRAGKKLTHTRAMLLILALAVAELTSNGVMIWRSLDAESQFVSREEYVSYDRRMETLAETVAVSDSDVYRIAALTEMTMNSSALIGQSGLSCFSSTNNAALMKTLRQAGYNSDQRVSYYYKSFTPLMDSVMNVKYVVYKENVGNPPYLTAAGASDGYYLYRNTLALPRAFAVADGLRGWNTGSENPFDVQNDFVRRAVSESDLTVYEPLTLLPDESLTLGAEYEDGRMTARRGGRLVLTASPGSRRHVYVYVNAEGASDISLSVGEKQYGISPKDVYVIDLGFCDEAENLTVAVTSAEALEGSVYAACLNETALEDSIARLGEIPAVFTEYSGTRIACRVETDKGGLLFTSIPCEKGWRATVNGKPADIVPIGGGLIGVPLSAGSNEVTLRYSVRGLTAGTVISLASILLAAGLLFGREIAAYAMSKIQTHAE